MQRGPSMDMIPSRTDTPEAAQWKLEMMDRMIRATLGVGGVSTAPEDAGTIDFNDL